MILKIAKSFLVIILLTVFVFSLGGCGNSNSLNGVWRDGDRSFEFSGNRVTESIRRGGSMRSAASGIIIARSELHGTFSLTSDQIEFSWTSGTSHLEDGTEEHREREAPLIEAFSFSRTENTITVGGRQYTRQ